MSRAAETYRGARRNACIRDLKRVWDSGWYYHKHRNTPAWAEAYGIDRNNQRPIYIPAKAKEKSKPATTKNAVHAMLKMGNYAGAVRRFFSRRSTGIGGG